MTFRMKMGANSHTLRYKLKEEKVDYYRERRFSSNLVFVGLFTFDHVKQTNKQTN